MLQVLTITLLCVAFSYAAVFAFQSVLTPLNPFDECITILAARAVANGMTPHGDFWTDYPALTYWIIAAAFKIFGNSYFVARFVSLAFYAAVLAVGWMVTPNWRSRTILTLGLILSVGGFYSYAPWNAFALLLIVLLLFCWKRRDTSAFWLLTGWLLAATLLMRVNFAGYGLVAIGAFLLLSTELNNREKLTKLGWLCTPMVLAVLAYCIICRNCLPAVYAQVIDFPTHALMRERILVIRHLAPGLLVLPFLLPARRMWRHRAQLLALLAILLGLTSLLLIDLHIRRYEPRPAYAIVFALVWILVQVTFRKLDAEEFTVLLCYLLFLHYYLARADVFHIWPALIVICLLALLKVSQWPIPAGARVDLVILVLTGALGVYLQPAGQIIVPYRFFYRYAALRLSPRWHENLRLELGFPQDGEAEALAYLLVHTSSDEYVYSGLLDHARGYRNNLRSYVILQRQIPVSDWEYEPGYSTQAQSQELAIRELERTRTNWLLLWHGDRNPNEMTRSRHGSSLLDTYIRSTFCVENKFDDYEVWRRCNWIPLFP
ncbi:MAG: ArnT family glycosyltransferase [Terriglobales bacterium]